MAPPAGIDRDHTLEFRGIRYARAPRFQRPVDVDEIESLADGAEFGPRAPQVSGPLEQMLGGTDLPQDDDCHFLNVYTPGHEGSRPVLVWIHGGAYVTGTAAMPWYDGNALARRGDVVVVSINYRLGALGFLGDRNLGSYDMLSALRWVQRHVGEFGGDPADVTLFGESAGGSAVVSLLAAEGADDLFARVWSMSPSLLQLRTAADGEDLARAYLDLLGTDDIQAAPLDALLDAQAKMPMTTAGLKNFAPTDHTELFPDPILRRASADPRPLVLGSNRDEMLLFTAFDLTRKDWDDTEVAVQFQNRFGDDAAEAIETYRRLRPEATTPSRLVSEMQTDEVFRHPVQRLATRRSDGSHPTWVYEFHEPSTAFGGILGACHGLDIPFAFDNLDRAGVAMFLGDAAERQEVADDFADALLSFARSGAAPWPRYDAERRATRIVGGPGAGTVVDDPEPDLRRLWPA